MSAIETIKAAYAAFGRNDPSVLFAAMDLDVFTGVGAVLRGVCALFGIGVAELVRANF